MGPNEKDLPATCDGLVDDDCDGTVNDLCSIIRESCDDCDGLKDEGPFTVKGGKPGEMANVGEACETGVGECKGPGVFVCEPGVQTCVNGKWSDCADDDLTDGTVNDLCSIIRESCDDVDGDTCDNCPNDEEGK